MPLLIATLLGLAALFVVITPLLGLEGADGSTAEIAPPEIGEQEQSAKRALRDVDFDHRLGNLDEADYVALRDRYEDRALEAMKTRYDVERALDASIERQLAALRVQGRTTRFHASTPSTHPSVANARTSAPRPRSRQPSQEVRGQSANGSVSRRLPEQPPGLRRRRGV